MVTNLGKFNTFVKEKQLKVERGISTEKAEKETRERMDIEIEQKEELLLELNQAKVKYLSYCHESKFRSSTEAKKCLDFFHSKSRVHQDDI